MIYNPADRLLWGIAVAILIIGGFHFFYKGYKMEAHNEKVIMLGFAGYFFGLALVRIFFYYADFLVPGNFIGDTYYGDLNNTSPTYKIVNQYGYIFGVLAIIFLMFALEIILKRTKYVLSAINIFLIVFISFLSYDLAKDLIYAISIINTFIFFLIFLFITRKAEPQFQAVSTLFLFGFMTILFGHGLDSDLIKEINLVPLVIPPLLYIIGTIIVLSPTLINPRFLSRTLIFWTIFSIYLVILSFIAFYISFYLEMTSILSQILFIFCVVLMVFSILAVYHTFNLIKSKKETKIEKKILKREVKDVFGKFTRPQKVTEEEVSVSKEKKICLVCKGSISRENYICPECNAFYCINCSRILANIENACWVCDVPFDESKPVKLPEKKEEEVVVGEEIHKKSKEKK